jgi:hypothetical protein
MNSVAMRRPACFLLVRILALGGILPAAQAGSCSWPAPLDDEWYIMLGFITFAGFSRRLREPLSRQSHPLPQLAQAEAEQGVVRQGGAVERPRAP